MYVKAHPFGYKKVNKPAGERTDRAYEVKSRKQIVFITQPVFDKDGDFLYNNTYVRTVQHYGRNHKNRTLTDMVYESAKI